jgi:multidrug transporter EmrE-like cation transporter
VNINWTNPFWSASLFLIYISTSCFGLYLIKSASGWKTSSFIIGFLIYGAGALIWMVIIRLMPLSFAFPIAAGSLMIGTMLTGIFFLNETIPAWHILGAFMIIIGIILFSISG